MSNYIQQLYSAKNIRDSKVYPGLNAAKGILILLVILTHALPDGMILYFLYFFHMPVFLSISGYLLKESAFKDGISKYLGKLIYRLIIPWIMASFLYLYFSLGNRHLSEITLTDFLYPFYHLWYVPAYVLGALLCYFVSNYKIPAIPVLIITALFTVFWYIFFRDNKSPVNEQPLYYLGEKRFYAYLVFFFLGFCLRNELLKISPSPLLLISLNITAFTASVIFVYQHIPDTIIVIAYMTFNLSFILFLLLYIAPQTWFQHKWLLLVNKQSLGVYLYHPMIIFLIYAILGDSKKEHINNLQALGVGIVTIVTVLSFIWIIQKWKVSNRYLLGMIKE